MAASASTEREYRNGIPRPLYFRHPSSLDHDTGAHPERADRIRSIETALAARDWLGWEVREAPVAEEEQLLRVHPAGHLAEVEAACHAARPLDGDTPVGPGSWDAALHSAGGACALVEALLGGEADVGFSALRPPGHHAESDRAMGFCLLSNVAIAARHALDALGAERVLVLDWDVHHGNGTEAVFRASPEVLFISVHQWPFYPGSGGIDYSGEGGGEGYTVNLPVHAGSGEEEWLGMVQHVAAPIARAYRPDLILVSAGFDAHRDDPLGQCMLEDGSYAELARNVRALSDELSAPVGAVLEGGYDLDALAASMIVTMEGLTGSEPPREIGRGELVDAATRVHRRHWPQLAAV